MYDKKRAWVSRVVSAALCWSGASLSYAESGSQRFRLQLAPHLALTAGMVGTHVLVDGIKTKWDGDTSCPGQIDAITCDPLAVPSIDRWVIGSAQPKFAPLSDVLLVASLVLPVAAFSASSLSQRSNSVPDIVFEDATVLLQTYAATLLLTTTLKLSVRRLRPFNYDARFSELRQDADSRLSFPSGHTSMAFASASFLSTMMAQRYPGRGWSIGVSAGGWVLASVVGVSRVVAGRHFPTDVVAGAALGTAVGMVIPRLHSRRVRNLPGSESRSFDCKACFMAIGGQF